MSLISRLGVVLGLDSAEFSAGLGKAEGDLKKFNTSASGTGLALAALGGAFAATAASAIQYADQINDVALANDTSVSSVLEFSQALSTNGGHLEDVGKIYSNFTRKLDEAKTSSQDLRKTFGELGISESDLANLSEQQIFDKAIASLGEMKDRTHANAIMFELLGKSMKTVDVQGLAQDYEKFKGTMEGMDKKFHDVGDAVDAWGRISAKLKQDVVKDFGTMFKDISVSIENFLIYMDTKYIPDTMEIVNKWRKAWHLGGDVKIEAPKIQNTMGGKDFGATDTGSWDEKVLGKTKEQLAEDKKREAAALKVVDAMRQQSLQYDYQSEMAGKQESTLYKLMMEFAKGGKYAGQENTELGRKLVQQAIVVDQKKEEAELQKILHEMAVAETIALSKKVQAGEDAVAAVTLRRQEEKESFKLATEDIEIAAERLKYEQQLAGLSDTQVQKALEYFDLRQKMKRMAETEVGLDDAQIAKRQKAEQDRINSEEANKRAQNTFQAGWNKAYNTWVEKASDSAALAADAFNSMASNMESALDTFVSTGKLSFSGLAQSIIQDLIKIQLKAQMMAIFGGGSSGGGIFSMFGGDGNFLTSSSTDFANGGGVLGWLGGLFSPHANGGSYGSNEPILVGEKGPELMVPGRSGSIVPNNTLSSMMGSQPQTVYNGTVVQNMQAIDTQSATQFLAKNKQAVWSANMSAQRGMPQNR